MPEDPSLALTALACGVMVLAGLVHGTIGLGFPLVATPLLALAMDVRAAILLTLLPTVAVNLASLLKGGKWGESIGRFWPLAAWALAGSVAGSRLLVVADPAPFKLLLAVLVLVYLGATRLGALDLPWVSRRLSLSMLVFGLAAGFAAGTTNVMVPILIVYALEVGLARTAMVQVFNLCFLAGKLSQIAVFGASGLLSTGLLLATAPLAALALVALFAGMRLSTRIPTDVYRLWVRRLLFALALVLLGQFASDMVA
jgi:uncharacterized protein